MSDIKETINYINSLLTASTGSFAGKPFQKGTFNGIAEQHKKTAEEEEDEYLIPMIMDSDSTDGTEVVIDDTYPFQLYHRIVGQKSEDATNEDTFGDGDEKSIIFEMVLIIFADRFNTALDADEYITALMLDIPKTIKASQVTSSQFSKCEITFTDTITNVDEVLSQEYGSKGFEIKQSYVALSFGYELKLTYSKGCFTLC